jgi:hypothetical protein
VPGFQYLGLDTFGTRVEGLRRQGLLPESFKEGVDYTVSSARNEKGEIVQSADFANLQAGLTAMTAMVADERRRFLNDVSAVLGPNVKPTEDQTNFFTYLYFNTGSGGGRRLLEANGLGLADKWTAPPPESNKVSARFNALQRLATWKMIDALGVFPS